MPEELQQPLGIGIKYGSDACRRLLTSSIDWKSQTKIAALQTPLSLNDLASTQLGQVTHFTGHSSGAPVANPSAVQETLLGYSTSFQLIVAGFNVIDSPASVRLNAQGQAVSLHFFSLTCHRVFSETRKCSRRSLAAAGFLPLARTPMAGKLRVQRSSSIMDWRAMLVVACEHPTRPGERGEAYIC